MDFMRNIAQCSCLGFLRLSLLFYVNFVAGLLKVLSNRMGHLINIRFYPVKVGDFINTSVAKAMVVMQWWQMDISQPLSFWDTK